MHSVHERLLVTTVITLGLFGVVFFLEFLAIHAVAAFV